MARERFDNGSDPLCTAPRSFDAEYAALLTKTKADIVGFGAGGDLVASQHGLAQLASGGRPEWPAGLMHDEPVIETYTVNEAGVTALSNNQPFVDAWLPNVSWLHRVVATALAEHGVALDGDAYVTASLTSTAELEGMAHMDDDTFVPAENVGVVAIIGEHAGPRVSTADLPCPDLRPMSQIQVDDTTLEAFASGECPHHQCSANQVAIFPQFGQLHAGPSAADVTHLGALRQLLVLRGKVVAS